MVISPFWVYVMPEMVILPRFVVRATFRSAETVFTFSPLSPISISPSLVVTVTLPALDVTFSSTLTLPPAVTVMLISPCNEVTSLPTLISPFWVVRETEPFAFSSLSKYIEPCSSMAAVTLRFAAVLFEI